MKIKERVETILLERGALTVKEIQTVLEDEGASGSQASVSRALKALGAFRLAAGPYSLPSQRTEPSEVEIGFRALEPDVQLPVKAHSSDAGFDVFSVEECVLHEGKTRAVRLGFQVEIPEGWEIQVRPRSGLAVKGVFVVNAPGTIDAGFQGEVKVLLSVMQGTHRINIGDKIAQLVVQRVPTAQFVTKEVFAPTLRGEAGFGSTGT